MKIIERCNLFSHKRFFRFENQMKWFFLFFSMLLLSGIAQAQKSPLSFGVKAGVSFSSSLINNDEAKINTKFGYQFGITADYRFSPSFLLQSGLLLSEKGSKIYGLQSGNLVGGDGTDPRIYNFNQVYLQLPVYAVSEINLTEDFKLVASLGPYVAYGVGGKTSLTLDDSATWGDNITEQKFDTFGDAEEHMEQLKPFDFGFGFGVHAECHKFIFGLTSELGILNLFQDTFRDTYSYRNLNAAFTVGYKF